MRGSVFQSLIDDRNEHAPKIVSGAHGGHHQPHRFEWSALSHRMVPLPAIEMRPEMVTLPWLMVARINRATSAPNLASVAVNGWKPSLASGLVPFPSIPFANDAPRFNRWVLASAVTPAIMAEALNCPNGTITKIGVLVLTAARMEGTMLVTAVVTEPSAVKRSFVP